MKSLVAWWPELLEAAAALAGCTPALVAGLLRTGDVCLGGEDDCRKASSLNNDGTPVQIVVVTGAGRRLVRLLMDPAHREPDPVCRCARALAAARRLLESLGEPAQGAAFEAALRAALPSEDEVRAWLGGGAIWLAADLEGRGVGAYVSARWGAPSQRWDRVLAWLGERNPAASERLGRLAPVAEPASVGLEAGAATGLRLKVYFRLRRPQQLGRLDLPGLDHPALETFLHAVVRDRSIGLSGLVLSVSTALRSEGMSSKVDVCGHCLRYSNPEWAEIIARLARCFAMPDPAVEAVLVARQAEMAFIGFSPSPEGAHRLNCYLKAPSSGPRERP